MTSFLLYKALPYLKDLLECHHLQRPKCHRHNIEKRAPNVLPCGILQDTSSLLDNVAMFCTVVRIEECLVNLNGLGVITLFSLKRGKSIN